MGRRPFDPDLKQVEQLAAIACTQEEAAAVLGVARYTLSRKLRQRKYREAWERGRGRGNMALRREQFEIATQKGNVTMLIWLGKQWLGQRDHPEFSDDARSAAEDYLAAQRGEKPGDVT